MLLYEVNILVSSEVESPFKAWLLEHIKEMECVEGVYKSTNFFSDVQNPLQWSVHYYFDSLKSFENYENSIANTMRTKIPSVLKAGVQIQRRVLLKINN